MAPKNKSRTMGIMKMVNSAKNIPRKYGVDLMPAKFRRYLSFISLSCTVLITYRADDQMKEIPIIIGYAYERI
jgi:hypothetical protein